MPRAYHATSASLATHDSGEPHGNGTTISLSKDAIFWYHSSDRPRSAESKRNFHTPFRFCHAGLIRSGRGCSGSGMPSSAAAEREAIQAKHNTHTKRLAPVQTPHPLPVAVTMVKPPGLEDCALLLPFPPLLPQTVPMIPVRRRQVSRSVGPASRAGPAAGYVPPLPGQSRARAFVRSGSRETSEIWRASSLNSAEFGCDFSSLTAASPARPVAAPRGTPVRLQGARPT